MPLTTRGRWTTTRHRQWTRRRRVRRGWTTTGVYKKPLPVPFTPFLPPICRKRLLLPGEIHPLFCFTHPQLATSRPLAAVFLISLPHHTHHVVLNLWVVIRNCMRTCLSKNGPLRPPSLFWSKKCGCPIRDGPNETWVQVRFYFTSERIFFCCCEVRNKQQAACDFQRKGMDSPNCAYKVHDSLFPRPDLRPEARF